MLNLNFKPVPAKATSDSGSSDAKTPSGFKPVPGFRPVPAKAKPDSQSKNGSSSTSGGGIPKPVPAKARSDSRADSRSDSRYKSDSRSDSRYQSSRSDPKSQSSRSDPRSHSSRSDSTSRGDSKSRSSRDDFKPRGSRDDSKSSSTRYESKSSTSRPGSQAQSSKSEPKPQTTKSDSKSETTRSDAKSQPENTSGNEPKGLTIPSEFLKPVPAKASAENDNNKDAQPSKSSGGNIPGLGDLPLPIGAKKKAKSNLPYKGPGFPNPHISQGPVNFPSSGAPLFPPGGPPNSTGAPPFRPGGPPFPAGGPPFMNHPSQIGQPQMFHPHPQMPQMMFPPGFMGGRPPMYMMPYPPYYFPSAPGEKSVDPVSAESVGASQDDTEKISAEEKEKLTKEALFPPGRSSDLQLLLEQIPDKTFIGLEYFIEIQHNTTKKAPPTYHCILCGQYVKVKDDKTFSAVELARGHLKSSGHKLKYLNLYFPKMKALKWPNEKTVPIPIDELNATIEQIVNSFGFMKVKLVVGMKLFKRKLIEIKSVIDDSWHFRENDDILKKSSADLGLPDKIGTDLGDGQIQVVAGSKRSSDSPKVKRSRDHSESRSRSRSRGRHKKKHRRRSRSRSKSKRYSSDTSSSSSSRSRSRNRSHRKSKKNKRRRQSSSSSSSSSSSNSSSGDQGIYSRKDKRIIEYLVAEEIIAKEEAEQKKDWLKKAEEHPSYAGEWSKFYNRKCDEFGVAKLQPEYIKDEWELSWKDFFFKLVERQSKEKRNRLLNKFQLFRADLADFRKKHPFYGMKPKSSPPPVIDLADEPARKRRSRSPIAGLNPSSREENLVGLNPVAPGDEKEEQKEDSTEKEFQDDPTVTVISTLRLLSAMERVIGSMGPKINDALAKATGFERNYGVGSSKNMVNDKSFYDLLDIVGEKLKVILRLGKVNLKEAEVSKICMDNIEILMKRSAKPWLQEEKDALKESVPDPSEIAIKAAIAKTVEEQFRKSGKHLSSEEMARIVDAEYQRVKGVLPMSALISATLEATATKRQETTFRKRSPEKDIINLDIPSTSRFMDKDRRYRNDSEYDRRKPSERGSEFDSGRSRDRSLEIDNRRYLERGPGYENRNSLERGSGYESRKSLERSVDQRHSYNYEAKIDPPQRQTESQRPNDNVMLPIPKRANKRANNVMIDLTSDPPSSEPVARETGSAGINWGAVESALKTSTILPVQQPPPQRPIEVAKPPPKETSGGGNMFEDLTVDELASLFKNFKELDRESKEQLIEYMKKLEKNNPTKVNELKQKLHTATN